MSEGRNELQAILEAAGAVGQVRHVDFAPFITVIERKKKVGEGRDTHWEVVGRPYMGMDGRVAMARRDHALQGKRLDFKTEVVFQDEGVVRVSAIVESEVYGTVTAYAESKLGGQGVESQHPVEVAETSSLGRALGFLGYGLIPGSGLASAEDMQRAAQADEAPAQQKPRRAASKAADDAPLSERGRSAMLVAFAQKNGMPVQVAAKELDNLCREEYGVAVSGLTTAQGREFWQSLKLSAEGDASQTAGGTSAAYLDDPSNRRRVLADVRENRLSDDPEATVEGWRAKEMEREEVEAALDVLRSERWRRRYFAGLKEMKVTAEQAKRLLHVEHVAELYEQNVDEVLRMVREGVEQAGT